MTREEAIDYLQDAKSALPHKFDKALDMAIEALSAPSGDLISRADAIVAFNGANLYQYALPDKAAAEILESIPSADAKPTVIRAKTFMRKEDFDKWADDIKKQHKSIVCIPCDAEVVSADAVVRCKDCRHRNLFSCPLADNDFQKDEDFCSWGERKEP